MLTLLARVLLFFSAFLPLFIIWALRTWPSAAAFGFISLSVLGVVGTVFVIAETRRDEGQVAEVSAVEERQSDVAAYLVTYLIPFVTAPLQTFQDWLAAGLFVFLLLVLYVSSDLVSVNPALALGGFRLYRVELVGIGSSSLLSRFRPPLNSQIVAVQIANSVYISLRMNH